MFFGKTSQTQQTLVSFNRKLHVVHIKDILKYKQWWMMIDSKASKYLLMAQLSKLTSSNCPDDLENIFSG
jgi:hypothetical protein